VTTACSGRWVVATRSRRICAESAVKKERSAWLRALSAEACRRRWRGKVGTSDVVLVDRPGRGYGDDYTPWLVDAPVGQLVHARGVSVHEEGVAGVRV
jgi:hypothetical protein